MQKDRTIQEVELYRLRIGDIITLIDGIKAEVVTHPRGRAVYAIRRDNGERAYLHAWGIKELYLKAADVPKPHTDEHVGHSRLFSRNVIGGVPIWRAVKMSLRRKPIKSVAVFRY